jgi:hypothetical protein
MHSTCAVAFKSLQYDKKFLVFCGQLFLQASEERRLANQVEERCRGEVSKNK